MSGFDVHIVGSVPLADAAAVFEAVGEALGDRVSSIPDGETGERLTWIGWLEFVFADNPAMEPTGQVFRLHPQAMPQTQYRLKPGVAASELRLGDLGYAANAERSYRDFKAAKQAGTIPARCRFQVDIAPAHTVVRSFVDEDEQATVEPIYDAALRAEIAKVCDVVPRDDLMIQLDIASAVFFRLEKGEPTRYGATKAEMQEAFSREAIALGACVPEEVGLIYHLCYGDSNHRHTIEPSSTADMVEFANRISRGIARPIQLFHMPVPRDRADDAYFEPFAGLRLRPETRLSLGLVHYTDGVDGTLNRIATAEKYVSGFLIATECGFGRRPPDTIAELLRIHAKVAKGP